MNNDKAFTMIEIIVTLSILGVLLTIALPNYQRSIRRAQARDAVNSLLAIQSGQAFYRQNNNDFCKSTCSNVTDINLKLGTNIIVGGNTGVTGFDCNAVNNVCRAVLSGPINLDLRLNEGINQSNGVVYCEATPVSNPCCQGGAAGKSCP